MNFPTNGWGQQTQGWQANFGNFGYTPGLDVGATSLPSSLTQQAPQGGPVWNGQAGQGPTAFGMPATTKFGFNMGTAQAVGSLAQTGFGIYSGLKQLSLAKEAQRVGMAFANRNLLNQTKTMNMALEDRTANRSAMYAGTENSMSPAQAAAYLDKNRFSTAPITRRG